MPFTLTRSILVILLPGAITLSPYLFNLLYTLPQFAAWYESHKTESYFFVFSAAVIIGSVYEGISSIAEVQLDKIIKKNNSNLDKEWYSYLCRNNSSEPVAYRYISRRATTMYFEFSMAYSMVFVGYGIALNLDHIDFFHGCFQKPAFVLIFLFYHIIFLGKPWVLTVCLAKLEVSFIKHNSKNKIFKSLLNCGLIQTLACLLFLSISFR